MYVNIFRTIGANLVNQQQKNEKQLFSERLNHALDIYGVPQKGKGRQISVAKMFGVSQKGASKWLEGQAFPETERLVIIAGRLNVNVQWLITGKGYINIESIPSPSKSSMKRIPLLNWKDAANWKKLGFHQNVQWSWADANIGPCAFALRVINNSMSPRYEIGDILTVDPELPPQHRTIVIAQKNDGEVVCRQLLIDGKKRYLKPNNLRFPALLINDKKPQVEIIGSVREVFMCL